VEYRVLMDPLDHLVLPVQPDLLVIKGFKETRVSKVQSAHLEQTV